MKPVGKQLLHQCPWCNKKYKTLERMGIHIAKIHPFDTLNANRKKISVKYKLLMLESLQQYIWALRDNLQDKYNKQLSQTVETHAAFRNKCLEADLFNKLLTNGANMETAFEQFEMFLNLGRPWQGGNFCPSLLIDLIWHAALIDQPHYEKLCKHFFNQLLPHCLPENEGKTAERFAKFERQFEHYHRRPYLRAQDMETSDEDGFAVFYKSLHKIRRVEVAERDARKAREKQDRATIIYLQQQERSNLESGSC